MRLLRNWNCKNIKNKSEHNNNNTRNKNKIRYKTGNLLVESLYRKTWHFYSFVLYYAFPTQYFFLDFVIWLYQRFNYPSRKAIISVLFLWDKLSFKVGFLLLVSWTNGFRRFKAMEKSFSFGSNNFKMKGCGVGLVCEVSETWEPLGQIKSPIQEKAGSAVFNLQENIESLLIFLHILSVGNTIGSISFIVVLIFYGNSVLNFLKHLAVVP